MIDAIFDTLVIFECHRELIWQPSLVATRTYALQNDIGRFLWLPAGLSRSLSVTLMIEYQRNIFCRRL